MELRLMTETEKDRAILLAEYALANDATVRAAAKHFGISKSTVHKDLTERLPKLSPALFRQVRELLERNKKERHIRGGLATKHKYEAAAAAAARNAGGSGRAQCRLLKNSIVGYIV